MLAEKFTKKAIAFEPGIGQGRNKAFTFRNCKFDRDDVLHPFHVLVHFVQSCYQGKIRLAVGLNDFGVSVSLLWMKSKLEDMS